MVLPALIEITYFDKPNTVLFLYKLFCFRATNKIYNYSDAQELYIFPKRKAQQK